MYAVRSTVQSGGSLRFSSHLNGKGGNFEKCTERLAPNALAAIQALYQTVTELKQDLGDKDQQIAELRARLAHLEQRQ